jgi:hypothetical protein
VDGSHPAGGEKGEASGGSGGGGKKGIWARINYRDAERRAAADEKRLLLKAEMAQLSARSMSEHIKSGGKPYLTPLSLAHAYTARPVPAGSLTAQTLSEQTFRIPEDCTRTGGPAATVLAVGFNQQAMDFGDRWLEPLSAVWPQHKPQQQDSQPQPPQPQPVKVLQLSVLGNALISTLFGGYFARRLAASADEEKRARLAVLRDNVFDAGKNPSTFVQPPNAPSKNSFANAAIKRVVADSAATAGSASSSSTAAPTDAPATPAVPTRTAMQAEPGWSIANPLLLHLFLLDSAGRIRWRAVGPPLGDDVAILKGLVQQLIDERAQQQRKGAPQQKLTPQTARGGRGR